jgi:uncharacterized protein (TIGR03435 family)
MRAHVSTWMLASALGVRLLAQAPDQPAFEAASVKANHSGDLRTDFRSQPNGRLAVRNATVKYLVLQAYGLQDIQLAAAPDWLAQEHFDITAAAPGGANASQTMVRLQTLLQDRFHLAAHFEVQDMPAYALVAPNGAAEGKLKPRADADCAALPEPGKSPLCESSTSPGGVLGRGMTMAALANSLSRWTGQPVIDKTEVAGRFDFQLLWTPDNPTAGIAPNPNRPALVTAIQEQLGLKLQAIRAPISVLVIDHVERPNED